MFIWALGIVSSLISFILGLQTQRLKSIIHKFFPAIAFGCLLGVNLAVEKNKSNRYVIFTSLVLCTYIGRAFEMVGLTGGIACGKSEITRKIREDYPEIGVIDCDEIAREIVQPGRRAWKKIKSTFGEEVLSEYGFINREILGDIIFANKEMRSKLNKITSPIIFWNILTQLIRYRLKGCKMVVVDAPILFETKVLEYLVYPIITVHISDEHLWIERLCERDSIDETIARMKIDSELPIAMKLQKSQIKIDNSGTLEELETKVDEILKELKKP